MEKDLGKGSPSWTDSKVRGSFEIVSKVGNVAYRLKLPDRLKVHPIFHLSYLKKYHPDLFEASRNVSTRASPTLRDHFTKEMEKNLDHRTLGQSKKNWRTDYLVQWKGESESDATWI
ncbi:Unknown protein [Striga hermonthica]|uniref:Chromo domain-containing protein n=1 Tax=Striga hermonthica TaxID=68872 RepID=A0A9N7N6J5_STRHE|nr:Unknown protein [Striga hermonthica]